MIKKTIKKVAKKVEQVLTPLNELSFQERTNLFIQDYNKLVAKYNIVISPGLTVLDRQQQNQTGPVEAIDPNINNTTDNIKE